MIKLSDRNGILEHGKTVKAFHLYEKSTHLTFQHVGHSRKGS
jgi:hypothetical protein